MHLVAAGSKPSRLAVETRPVDILTRSMARSRPRPLSSGLRGPVAGASFEDPGPSSTSRARSRGFHRGQSHGAGGLVPRSASCSQLGSGGAAKLPPISQRPVTFEELYKVARRQVSQKSAEARKGGANVSARDFFELPILKKVVRPGSKGKWNSGSIELDAGLKISIGARETPALAEDERLWAAAALADVHDESQERPTTANKSDTPVGENKPSLAPPEDTVKEFVQEAKTRQTPTGEEALKSSLASRSCLQTLQNCLLLLT